MARTISFAERLDHLMMALGLTAGELAMAIGASERTVHRWLADETFPQHDSRDRLEALAALADRLEAAFGSPEGATTWLRAESGYFGGLRPLDALLRGRIDAVEAALDALDAGVFV